MTAHTPVGYVFSDPPAGPPEGHRRVLSHLAAMLDPFTVRRLEQVATTAQVRDELIAHGMTAADIDRFRALLLDPRLVIHGNMAVSTVGRRP